MSMTPVRNRLRGARGQVMTEFLLVAAATMLFFVILAIFLNAYLDHSYRVLNLLSSQYP
jgi:hypothetical protein